MLVLVSLALFQDLGPAPPTPFDRVVAIEIRAADAPLEGCGPSTSLDYTSEFSGTLHVWTKAAEGIDLFLQIDEVAGTLIAGDDNSGGGLTPYLKLVVEPGRQLRVRSALAQAQISDAPTFERIGFEIHLLAAPETEATRKLAATTTARLAEIKALRERNDLVAARTMAEAQLSEILAANGCTASEVASEAVRSLANEASELLKPRTTRAARHQTYAHRLRVLPGDHLDLQLSRVNLAATMRELGDFASARALEELVLDVFSRTLPADHTTLQWARLHLAATMSALGDFSGARALQESVVEIFSRNLPQDHAELQAARTQLALSLGRLGDHVGARALEELVLEVRLRTLPPDHPDLQRTRVNLASTLWSLGDVAAALALQVSALDAFSRTLPADHLDLQRARQGVVGSSRVDLQACKLEYSIVSPK